MPYINIVLNIIPTLYEGYIVSVLRMVMENRPVDPGSIQGSHRPISFIRIKHRPRADDILCETEYLLVIGGKCLNTCSRPICDALVLFAVNVLTFYFCRNLTDVCLLKQGGSRYPPLPTRPGRTLENNTQSNVPPLPDSRLEVGVRQRLGGVTRVPQSSNPEPY